MHQRPDERRRLQRQQLPARRQHPMDFLKQRGQRPYVMKHQVGDHQVKAVRRKRQIERIGDHTVKRFLGRVG